MKSMQELNKVPTYYFPITLLNVEEELKSIAQHYKRQCKGRRINHILEQ